MGMLMPGDVWGRFIERLTKDCKREDCAITGCGQSTTLLGFSQTYDKRGRPQHRDPNTTTSHYSCTTCGTQWVVKSRDGEEDTISTVRPEVRVPPQDAPDGRDN